MVNRKFLYWGVFFVALGAVLVAEQGNLVSGDTVAPVLDLWPAALIAIGIALVLRRTRIGLAGGVIAAALPGLLLGGLVVAAPSVSPPSCHVVQPSSYTTSSGTFVPGARVELDLSCGEVEVGTAPGSDWQLGIGDTGVSAPRIATSAGLLSVRSAGRRGPFGLGNGDAWRLTLPQAQPLSLSATVNAGSSRFDLGGAQVTDLSLVVNAGEARVQLPSSDATVSVDANAAKVSLCVPDDTAVHVSKVVVLGSVQLHGLVETEDGWLSPTSGSATHHANVTLRVNVGSVDFNPEGGCK